MILRSSEVGKVIQYYFSKYEGGNYCKLHSRIRHSFAGVRKHVIHEWTNPNRKHREFQKQLIFENKDPLQPSIAKSPIDVCQIALVIMEKRPSIEYNNKPCFYILYVIDVFCRYIFLKPLQSKESLEVTIHLR